MRSRFYFYIFLLVMFKLNSLEIGLVGGFSTFRYLEVSENLKEDLYTINSGYIGLRGEKSILDNFMLIANTTLQMPHEVYLEDLYGKDSNNYLDGMFYYGLNNQVGISYQLIKSRVELSLGVLFNMDFFYFKDLEEDSGKQYYFSSLGNGVEVDFSIPISNINIGILSSFNINYIPLHSRGDEFKWANNFRIGPYFSIELP